MYFINSLHFQGHNKQLTLHMLRKWRSLRTKVLKYSRRCQMTFKADYKQILFKLYWDLEISKGTCNQFFWLSLLLLDKSLGKELCGIILWQNPNSSTLRHAPVRTAVMDLAGSRVWPLSTIHFPLQILASRLFKFSLLSSPPDTLLSHH